LIEIDGSYGEGGGQLLRYSVALAALLRKELRVYNIRAKRSNPGLRPQHLNAVKLIANLVGAEVEGLRVGSTEIVFKPKRRPRGGRYEADIGTAGSISLFLQATLPVLLSASGEVFLRIRGGTNVKWSPPIQYMQNVLLPLLSGFGVKAEINVERLGFYPRGGGIVSVRASPSYPLKPVRLDRFSEIKGIWGLIYIANLPRHIAERQAASARRALEEAGYGRYIREFKIDSKTPAIGAGTGTVLWAVTDVGILGGDSLGERGKRSEVVGREAAEKLIAALRSKASVDVHALDNVVIYMALAEGKSVVYAPELTSHAKTAMDLCRWITGARFNVEKGNGWVKVEAEGIGFRPS